MASAPIRCLEVLSVNLASFVMLILFDNLLALEWVSPGSKLQHNNMKYSTLFLKVVAGTRPILEGISLEVPNMRYRANKLNMTILSLLTLDFVLQLHDKGKRCP